MEVNNFGDEQPVGEGVSELRVDHGPGYRVHYGAIGLEVVLQVEGGDKSTRKKDLINARARFKSFSELKR